MTGRKPVPVQRPAPGMHNYRILPCPGHPGGTWHFWSCRRCGVTSACYPSRRVARIAGDHFHDGGTPVVGFDHLGVARG